MPGAEVGAPFSSLRAGNCCSRYSPNGYSEHGAGEMDKDESVGAPRPRGEGCGVPDRALWGPSRGNPAPERLAHERDGFVLYTSVVDRARRVAIKEDEEPIRCSRCLRRSLVRVLPAGISEEVGASCWWSVEVGVSGRESSEDMVEILFSNNDLLCFPELPNCASNALGSQFPEVDESGFKP